MNKSWQVTVPARVCVRLSRYDHPLGYTRMVLGTVSRNDSQHWTRRRLDRNTVTQTARFGSPTYSKEELVAEFGAAYLCRTSGITNTIDNSAAYIGGWLKKLRNDKRLAIVAAAQGHKAADYILVTK